MHIYFNVLHSLRIFGPGLKSCENISFATNINLNSTIRIIKDIFLSCVCQNDKKQVGFNPQRAAFPSLFKGKLDLMRLSLVLFSVD